MALEAQEMLRNSGGGSANTAERARWAQALARAADTGVAQGEVLALLRAAGIPIGSAYGQWALQASLGAIGENHGDLNDLLRPIGAEYQKPPVGDQAYEVLVSNPQARPQ